MDSCTRTAMIRPVKRPVDLKERAVLSWRIPGSASPGATVPKELSRVEINASRGRLAEIVSLIQIVVGTVLLIEIVL